MFGAVTALKFLQKLALDFPYIRLQFFPENFYRKMYRQIKKKVLGLLAHVTPSNFFSRILKSEALVYNSYFFQNSRFKEIIYSTLDSHTNTVILTCLPTQQDGVENHDKVYAETNKKYRRR